MPATSEAQAHFMRAIAHGWKPTQAPYKNKELPSKAVAQEFSHMAHGGEVTCPKCGHMFASGGEVSEPDDYFGDDDDLSDFSSQGRDFSDSYSGPSFDNGDARRSFITMIRLHR